MERAIQARISERAFALYEESGRQTGNDQQNWMRAKSEVLRSFETRESGTWLSLTAAIPDASPESIRIYVDPNRVMACAESLLDATPPDSARSATTSEVFLDADLAEDVDPATASASFKDQTLRVMVRKRAAAAAR